MRGDEGHLTCVGSLAELSELTGRDQTGLDPHRPYIDEVTFACPVEGCTDQATRVPEVIDAWYDSGSMPFAQWGYPYRNAELFNSQYPAQFICEAIDQTRGWFYTLMAVGTLVFDRSSYENVLCLGHILAEDGRKMSKHLGNIPTHPLMSQQGRAVRWLCRRRLPGLPLFGHLIRRRRPQVLLTTEHGRLQPSTPAPPTCRRSTAIPRPADRPLRRAARRGHVLVTMYPGARRLGTPRVRNCCPFVDDLSNGPARSRRLLQGDTPRCARSEVAHGHR